MKLGKPRLRRSKSFSLLGGLIRARGNYSKTKGRQGRITGSLKIGPWSGSTTGRQQLSFFGIQIPIYRKGG